MTAPMLRLTISASYRSGAEVLLGDSGPLATIAAAREALSEIDAALDTHADLICVGGATLIVRLAERRFARMAEDAPVKPRTRLRAQDDF